VSAVSTAATIRGLPEAALPDGVVVVPDGSLEVLDRACRVGH